jgi:ubiquinone/menaquinone biosynthesis C-methylase UbiE
MQINGILELLRCPECYDPHLRATEDEIRCTKCDASFDVIEGIPVLLQTKNLNKQEKSQKEWFEKHYAAFSDSDYKLEKWRESMLNRIFDNDFKPRVKKYLDIGCGATGYTVIEAAKRNGWFAVGTDISIEAMVRAKKIAEQQGVGERTAFITCSAENAPLRDNLFDYISQVSILEHLEHDRAAVMEVSRLLAKEGYVFVCVPNAYRNFCPLLWPLYYYNDRKIGHKRHYSIQTLDQLFENHAFKQHSVRYNGHAIKIWQIVLEKLGMMNDQKWWDMEMKDINSDSSGLQLNAIYLRGKL